MGISRLRVENIRTDGGTQARVQLDWIAIDEYAAAMKDGQEFPPLVVFYDGSEYWLADGFHRLDAAKRAGILGVDCDVRQGTKVDAVIHACGANSEYGVRRTEADGKRAVEMLWNINVDENRGWTVQDVARKAKVRQSWAYEVTEAHRLHAKAAEKAMLTARILELSESGLTQRQIAAEVGVSQPAVNRILIQNSGSGILNQADEPQPELTAMEAPSNDDDDYNDDEEEAWERIGEKCSQCRHNVSAKVMGEYTTICAALGVEMHIDAPGGLTPCYDDDAGELIDWEPQEEDKHVHAGQMPAVEIAGEPLPIDVIQADSSRFFAERVNEPVHLLVTSPPYNVGINYGSEGDNLSTYFELIQATWAQCHSAMADGGRICVVVPFGVGRNPWAPLASKVMETLSIAGFTLRGQIIWDKNTTGNRTTWGSFRLPSNPSLRDTTECIIVAHKGDGALAIPDEVKTKDEKGLHSEWLKSADYFMDLAQDHWVVAPESAKRVGHPAPFPVDLVMRLAHFYGYPGMHIADPFAGSGTVGVAAKALGCRATLMDISFEYCELMRRRIA